MTDKKEENILNELKPTKKGVFVVLILLVIFPLMIDSLLLFKGMPSHKTSYSLSKLLIDHYLGILPFFFIYLCIALLCMFFYNKFKALK